MRSNFSAARLLPACAVLLCMHAAPLSLHQGVVCAQENEEPTLTQAQQKQKLLQERYDKAFAYYQGGEHGRALQIWSEILQIDPSQVTARKMIEEVRPKVEENTRDKRRKFYALIAAGRFQKALLDLQYLLDQDPTHPRYQVLQARLERVIRVVAEAPAQGKAWKMALLGLQGYLGEKDDAKLALNGLRYANDLGRDDAAIARLLDIVASEYPDLVRAEPITPGMKFLDYKRRVSLYQIYDGKYHLAINTLDEILALEPKDALSLKRLGSAYYSLGHVTRARKYWEQALEFLPNDKQLKKFLAKTARKGAPARSPAN